MASLDQSRLHPAFVLHRRAYSNTSLLLECFTAISGRFPVIAKGVRARSSGGIGLLQPFTPLLIGWAGRGEVKTLTSFEIDGTAINLERRALYCGFYVNELIMRLLERNDPHERLFALYKETLTQLAASRKIEQLLRRFERLLLTEIGYGLLLDQDAETGKQVDPDERYHYELERGPLLAKIGSGFTVKGQTLLGLAQDQQLDKEGSKEARLLMRQVLAHYLGDRPLKSRELFKAPDMAQPIKQ